MTLQTQKATFSLKQSCLDVVHVFTTNRWALRGV